MEKILIFKHHLAKNIKKNPEAYSRGGAARGGTVFIDYNEMIKYLKDDEREWAYCVCNVNKSDLDFNFGNNYMATILKNYNNIFNWELINENRY